MFDDFDGAHAEFTSAGKILRLAPLTPEEPTVNFDAWLAITANLLLDIDRAAAELGEWAVREAAEVQ